MTKKQTAILVVLGLAVVCILGIGGYIVVSEETDTPASQPTDTPAPTDTLIPPTSPSTPIPPTSTLPVPLLSATPDIAEPSTVAVTFTGTVTHVRDNHGLLGAGVRIGNPITGTVFYTLGKSDQDPLPHQGHYDFAVGEMRFVVQIGKEIFDTGLNCDGLITTMDNHPRHGDHVVFHSSTNIPPSEDMRLRIVSISMQDSQPNPDAVQSDALPSDFHPADWDLIYLTLKGDREIYYPDYDYTEDQRYTVRADIVSDAPSPPPTPLPPPSPAAATLTVASYLYPAPGLVGPRDGSNFKPNDDILLIWDTPTPLAEDEWYEVQLWRVGDVPYTVAQRTKEGTWKVDREYYPGRYQWRILIVRGPEGQRDLSRPSQTWSFSWLSPGLQTPTPPTSLLDLEAPVDLTVYLRGTNNAQGFAEFPGEEHVNAGMIYSEGSTVYGDVAARIGDTVYHFDKEPAPGEPEQLPDPYRLEVKFSDSLIAATEGFQPGFNPKKAQFWVGTLKCNSAVSDKPYKIEMTLYAGGEARKHIEIRFLVSDNPLCGVGPDPERVWQPPPTYTPTPLYSPTPTPTPSCDLTVYLRGTNNAEGFAAFSGEHVDAGGIYTEGGYVYGEIAVRIGSREYHYYEQEVCPPRPDGLPFRVEFKFSDSLLAATKGVEPQFNESNLRFWAGILDCNSATPKPYRIEATLYKDEKIRKHTEISFLVLDDPLCGVEAEEPEGIPIPTPRGRPRPP